MEESKVHWRLGGKHGGHGRVGGQWPQSMQEMRGLESTVLGVCCRTPLGLRAISSSASRMEFAEVTADRFALAGVAINFRADLDEERELK